MPRLTIPRAALYPALQAIDSVVEARNTIPVLSHLRLTLAEEGLTLTGTDMDIEITVRREHGLQEGDGSICIPSRTLREVVGKLADDADITLEWEGSGESLSPAKLKAGRSRFTLPPLPPEDFPVPAPRELPYHFTLPAATLAALLARVRFAISNEETRYYLNGVFLHQDGAAMAFVATDGHRLAKMQHAMVLHGTGTPPAIIIPRKTVDEVIKLGKASKDSATLEWGPSQLRLTIGATTLTSKLIDGTFPDYARVIPRQNPESATFGTEAMAAALARVTAVAGEKGRAVRFRFEGESLTLGTASDTGTAEEEVEASYSGTAPLEIGFNAAYLAEALRALGTEKASLALKTPGDSTLITTPEDEAFLSVLMPMRV